jgi:hypothetical protein
VEDCEKYAPSALNVAGQVNRCKHQHRVLLIDVGLLGRDNKLVGMRYFVDNGILKLRRQTINGKYHVIEASTCVALISSRHRFCPTSSTRPTTTSPIWPLYLALTGTTDTNLFTRWTTPAKRMITMTDSKQRDE